MALTLYWVGDTDGTWNTVNNWAVTSGGVGGANGATVPTINDAAILDANYTTQNCICDVGIEVASLDLQSSYDGDFDFGSDTHNSAGNMEFSGTGTVSPNTCTIDCGGDFDYGFQDFDTPSAWTLNMNGADKTLGVYTGTFLHNLNISGNTYIASFFGDINSDGDTYIAPGSTATAAGIWTFSSGAYTLNIAGTLSIPNGRGLKTSCDVKIPTGGTLTGAGSAYWWMYEGEILDASGTISIPSIRFYNSVTLAPGTYNSTVNCTSNLDINHSIDFAAGNYIFPLAVDIIPDNDISFYTVNLSLNPNITFKSDLVLDEHDGAIVWDKGTGTLTFDGTGNQSVDILYKSVENIDIDKPSGLLTFTGNIAATSFTATAGNFDPSYRSFVITGDFTILEGVNPLTEMSSANLWDGVDLTVGGTFVAWGSPSDQCNLQGDGGWSLNVATAGSANNVIVSGSNAAAGVDIYAKDSTDGGGTSNWVFWETRKPLVVGELGEVQQLQTDDGLNVGDYDLPNTLSSDGKVLVTVNSEAVWAYASHADLTNVSADQHHNEAHTIASHNDTTATGAELETLTDGSDADALHTHSGSNHTIASHNDTTGTGAELETLTDGSNADSLHEHNHTNLTNVTADQHHNEAHTIASHSDTTATGTELETLTDGSNADSLHEHTYAASPSGNVTYYIATSGDDTTGNGSIASPWETLDKPLEVLYDTEFQYHAVATIELADGTYEHREQIILDKAPSLVIQGNSVLAYTINSINAVIDNDPSYDAQLTVNTTTGMDAGFYLGVTSATSRKYLNGGWEIISVDDGTHVTIRVESPLVAVAAGAVTATAIMPTSVLEMLDSVGLDIKAGRIQLTDLTVSKGTDGDYGIVVNGGQNVTIGPDVVVNGFPLNGIKLSGALCEVTDTYISDCVVGLYALNMSYCFVDGGSYSGCTAGLKARASYINLDGSYMAGNSGAGLHAGEFSMIASVNGDYYGCGIGAHVSNESYGRVQGTNTFADCTTDRSPATGEGNFNSYMLA